MSKDLRLSLKTKWFEMTRSGVKTEDYREITDYWCKRLLQCNKDLHTSRSKHNCKKASCISCLQVGGGEPVKFDTNTMTLGYPSKADTSKILTYKHAGIEIREGNPEWGAEKGKIYFVIKHGEVVI